MTVEEIQARIELKELADTFSNLSDTKDAAELGKLFLPSGRLEFQTGFDGEINSIKGREALTEAFAAALASAKSMFHITGQQTVTLNEDCTREQGIVYCQATFLDEEDILTTNYIRYSDKYIKSDGKWYIECRRSTFLISEKRKAGK